MLQSSPFRDAVSPSIVVVLSVLLTELVMRPCRIYFKLIDSFDKVECCFDIVAGVDGAL